MMWNQLLCYVPLAQQSTTKYNITLSESDVESVAIFHYVAKITIILQAASDVVEVHPKDNVIDV